MCGCASVVQTLPVTLQLSSPCRAGRCNHCGVASAGGALMTPPLHQFYLCDWWGNEWQEAARASQD